MKGLAIKVKNVGTRYAVSETTSPARGVRQGTLLELPIWVFPFEPKPGEEFSLIVREKAKPTGNETT